MSEQLDLRRAKKPFKVQAPYKPSGDQPQAIAELTQRINNGEKDIVLLGATAVSYTHLTLPTILLV